MGKDRERALRCGRKLLRLSTGIAFSLLSLILIFAGDLHAAGSYTITATAGSGGSISPSGAVSVKSGTNKTFTITPNTGYHIAVVTVDGVSQGAISSYTFTNVRANHTINASFAINTFIITASAGSGGTISPSGSVVVNYSANQSFSITPNTGYHVVSVTVDGNSQGAITSYTFSNVTANHTISATFAINSYTLTTTAGSGGTITPSTVVVNYGGSQSFSIAPNANYHIADVTVDGNSQGAVTSYTFSNVTANHTISATFDLNTFRITATAGNGGSISPSGTAIINYGGSQAYTITPNSGYNYVNVMVDGVSKGSITSYTFNNVTANHTISATFATNAPPSQSTANYFYDDFGRLSRVVTGTSGVVYTYDELGNLVSTTSTTTTNGSPVLSSVTPNVIFTGTSMLVTITGQNLLTTQSVASVNSLFTIRTLSVTDTTITAYMTALSAGSDSIRVTTANGTPNYASIGITLSSSVLAFSPGQLAIVPGGTGNMTASVSPPPVSPLTINLASSNPVIVTVPQTVTIPTGGSASFTVNGLQLGVANISAGGPYAVVFVSNPFSHDENGDTFRAGAQSISVMINAPAGTSPSTAAPVSVAIDAPAGTFPSTANPISVAIDTPVGSSTTPSLPVSVNIQ
jgi:YD repeat-containing protein